MYKALDGRVPSAERCGITSADNFEDVQLQPKEVCHTEGGADSVWSHEPEEDPYLGHSTAVPWEGLFNRFVQVQCN